MEERDDGERTYRIRVRTEEEARLEPSPHPAAGIEPPVARDDRGAPPAAPPEAQTAAEPERETAEAELPVVVLPETESPAEPTVARSRYLELARENMRLTEEVRKLQGECYQLKAQQQTSEEKSREAQERALRLQAEFQNYRRRTEREKEEAGALAQAELLRELLGVLDNFDRAVQAPNTSETFEDFHKGVHLIKAQLESVLQACDLLPLAAVGLAFDPNVHEAVMRSNHPTVPADHVVAEHRRGYTHRGRLLRPALVEVSTGAPPEVSTEGQAEEGDGTPPGAAADVPAEGPGGE